MKVVILKHAFFESPDYILDIIKNKKFKYKIINIYKNETLPSVDSFDFLIIMGGPMGVYEEDKYPWLK
ncbi:MAG: amidotransferase, partial [Candidatus Goldbacteria bacterium]|nr:amidotransferase [Candidatus Goldiibacteriota bacterium]